MHPIDYEYSNFTQMSGEPSQEQLFNTIQLLDISLESGNREMVEAWFQDNLVLFFSHYLHRLPQSTLIQFTVLLVRAHELNAFEWNSNSIHYSLPPIVVQYFVILRNPPHTFDYMTSLTLCAWQNNETRNRAIAAYLSLYQVSLRLILEALPLYMLTDITQYMSHVDIRGIEGVATCDLIINSLKEVRVLNIDHCNVSSLPSFEHLESLSCRCCTSLARVDSMPKCKFFDFSGCINLNHVPMAFPSCQEMVCPGCVCLPFMPFMPMCTSLDCRNCVMITELRCLFECIELNFSGCLQLEMVLNIEKCQNLIGDDCPKLSQLSRPAMNAYVSMQRCPLLTGYTQDNVAMLHMFANMRV